MRTSVNFYPSAGVIRSFRSCSRLRKLARLARPPVCVPVVKYPHLEEWVHDSGRMLVIGQAAHPLPVSSKLLACTLLR